MEVAETVEVIQGEMAFPRDSHNTCCPGMCDSNEDTCQRKSGNVFLDIGEVEILEGLNFK